MLKTLLSTLTDIIFNPFDGGSWGFEWANGDIYTIGNLPIGNAGISLAYQPWLPGTEAETVRIWYKNPDGTKGNQLVERFDGAPLQGQYRVDYQKTDDDIGTGYVWMNESDSGLDVIVDVKHKGAIAGIDVIDKMIEKKNTQMISDEVSNQLQLGGWDSLPLGIEITWISWDMPTSNFMIADRSSLSRVTHNTLFEFVTNPKPITIDIATSTLTQVGNNAYRNNHRVRLETDGSFPPELNSTTDYWIINQSGDNFQLSTTKGGAAISLSGSQSGLHTIRSFQVYGPGDGSTTFELPDTLGVIMRNAGVTSVAGLVDYYGNPYNGGEPGEYSGDQNRKHNHGGGNHLHSINNGGQLNSSVADGGVAGAVYKVSTLNHTNYSGTIISYDGGNESKPVTAVRIPIIKVV